jgi:hypothetical protein
MELVSAYTDPLIYVSFWSLVSILYQTTKANHTLLETNKK